MNPLLSLAIAFAGTATLALSAPALLSVDVKARGAVGDGVADDTVALQNALTGGRRVVQIPAGTYQIRATLRVDSDTKIQADPQAVIRWADHAATGVDSFLLTNRDYEFGNSDIVVEGGIWDGNNEQNPRGQLAQAPCYTGVALNFIHVRHLTLRNLTVRNPDSYSIRGCKLADFLIENIGFDDTNVRQNQDGVHLNGYCERGVIRNLRALSPYATNDDMVALNADDGEGSDYVIQQGMISGPIRDVVVEHLRAESAFTFVRLLSYRHAIENVTVRDVAGGCRFYAINMDRWKFPPGAGLIRNVTLRDFNVRKMPDDFSKQVRAGQRSLIHLQTAVQNFRIENFRRGPDDVPAETLVLENGQAEQLRFEGLTPQQEAERTSEAGKVTVPRGGFAKLEIAPGSAGTTEVYRAGADWTPIAWQPARIVKGSALDFSTFLDAPAGQFGPAIVQGGQLVFRDAPSRPVRLYGCVVSHALPFLEKKECEQLADYLAASGYSGVRLHSYNFAKGVMKEIGSAEFTPEAQDQLDYFFFCLKQRGIYFTFPLNAWGFFKAGDASDIPEFRDRPFRFESNGLLPISAKLQTWFQDYSRRLLGHVNPYTGLALKDDPALITLEIANESSLLAVLGQYPELVPLYRDRCRASLVAQLGREPAPEELEKALPEYVLQLEQEYFAKMKAFLRGMGVQQPLTDANFRDNYVYALPRSEFDYVDAHAYWALYRNLTGPKESGEPPYRQTWVNPITADWMNFPVSAPCRLFGQPFMNSEFNGCYPTPYWSFTGPAEAMLAAGQGWSGVFRCGLGAQPTRLFNPSPVRRIETGPSPLMMFSERIGALLFAQGAAGPLPAKVPLVVTEEYLHAKLDLAGGPRPSPAYLQLAFRYQLGTLLLNGKEHLDDYACLVVPADMELPPALAGRKVLRADTDLLRKLKELLPQDHQVPGLQTDPVTGAGRIVTPRGETFLLPAEIDRATGSTVQVAGNDSVSVCFAGSLDHQPLASSRRILALYLTDLKNSGTEVEHEAKPKESVIVRQPGGLPLLVRQGKIQMNFRRKEGPLPQIWALKYDGSRAVRLEPKPIAGGFTFEARAVTNPETFSAFELVWEPSS